jgi:hypothetical protein
MRFRKNVYLRVPFVSKEEKKGKDGAQEQRGIEGHPFFF